MKNVLSLFDGMSCGQIALNKAGIKYETYYASEIDKYTIKVTQENYPDTVQLGDITKWKEWGIDFSKIDLILAGSPCQGFSFAGKQLDFSDPRSALFFVFAEILLHAKKSNPDVKFLLENVRMRKESEEVISDVVGVSPITINSALVSAQNRVRLYWTNIVGVLTPQDKGILLRDVTSADVYRQKSQTILSTLHKENVKSMLKRGKYGLFVDDKGRRKLSPLECERLQTVPEGYTSKVSTTQRYRMLGNGWTVDVITHILSFIK